MIELLISAKTDEASGIQNAFKSITDWLLDKERFEADWTELILKLIVEIEAYDPHVGS